MSVFYVCFCLSSPRRSSESTPSRILVAPFFVAPPPPPPLIPPPGCSAWEEFSSGSESPVSLLDGSSAVPSRAVVYTASLLSSATTTTSADEQVAVAVAVPLAVAEAGAYTLLLNHGEIPAAMVSPTGETLASVAAEDRYHEVHAEDEEEEEEEEEGTGNITASQWANALTASFLISLCRLVYVDSPGGEGGGERRIREDRKGKRKASGHPGVRWGGKREAAHGKQAGTHRANLRTERSSLLRRRVRAGRCRGV